MEELLFKALREYRQIEGEARKAGVEVPPAEREAFFRSQTGGQFGWEDAERTLGGIDTSRNVRNLLWSALQGGLFNFGDEAVGLLNPRAAEKRRLEEEMFKEQHPATDMAAGIAGGAATGIGAGLALGRSGVQLGARTLGQIARRGAAAGAGAGALSGAGMGDTMGDRATNAAVGGAFGGALGGAVPYAWTGIRNMVSPSGRAAARLSGAADASGGEQALLDRVGDYRNAGRGDLVTLSDLSPELRAQGEFAMHNSDKTRAASLDFLEGRSAGSTERILDDTREALGGQSGDASGRLRELSASRRAFGNAEYDRLREAGPDLRITKRAEEYLTQPRVQAMWDEANQTGLIGMRPDLADLSMSKALDIRDQLTGAISRAHKAGNNQLRENLQEVRRGFNRILANQSPDLRGVDAEYARRMGLERGVKAGIDAWKKNDMAELGRVFDDLSPVEQNEFRTGLAGQLINLLGGANTGRDMARVLEQASPSMAAKLRIIFPDDEVFNAYMDRVAMERAMRRTGNSAFGSDTHRRGMQGSDALIQGALGADPMTSVASNAVAGGLRRGFHNATATELGQSVLNQGGADAAEKIIRDLYVRGMGVSPALQYGAPTGMSAGLLDLLGKQ